MAKLDLNKISFEDFDTLHKSKLISNEDYAKAKNAAGRDFIFNFWDLTLNDLDTIFKGQIPKIVLDILQVEGLSAAEFLKRENAFEHFIDDFFRLLGKLQVKPTADEKRANQGLPKFERIEGFLTFCKDYFHHTSFEQSLNTTLGDLYLAKKDSHAQKLFTQRLHNYAFNKNIVSKKSHK